MLQQFEDFPTRDPSGFADCRSVVANALAEGGCRRAVVVGGNRVSRDELACVSEERFDLCVDKTSDVFDVIGFVSFKEEGAVGSVNIEAVMTEIVRIAGCDYGVEREPTGVAVIRMKSVTLPGVVRENDIGLR